MLTSQYSVSRPASKSSRSYYSSYSYDCCDLTQSLLNFDYNCAIVSIGVSVIGVTNI